MLGTAGNVSARAGELVAVTPTGAAPGRARRPSEVVGRRPRRRARSPASSRPTSELGLHLGVYRRYGAGAVVHTHAPIGDRAVLRARRAAGASTTRCSRSAARSASRRTPRSAPRSSPRSPLDALEGRTAALMANHGAIAFGPDLDDRGRARAAARVGVRRCTGGRRAIGTPRTLDADQPSVRRRRSPPRGYGDSQDGGAVARDARDRSGRPRRRRARAPGRGDPRGPGRAAGRADPDHRRRPGRRHRAHAGQARRRRAQRRRDRHRRAGRHARRLCSTATASTRRCSCAATDVQTSASVLPIRPDGSRPAFHVVGANATYSAADAPWDAIAAATHLHLGAPEFMGGEEAAQDPRRSRASTASSPRPTSSPRASRPRRSSTGSRRRFAHLDYLLPNDEQVLGAHRQRATSPRAAARCSSAASAASPRPAGRDGRRGRRRRGRRARAGVRGRRRRHHRLRRRLLGRLPARPVARPRPSRRPRRSAAPRAALVAQGLGSDHGDFDLDHGRGLINQANEADSRDAHERAGASDTTATSSPERLPRRGAAGRAAAAAKAKKRKPKPKTKHHDESRP